MLAGQQLSCEAQAYPLEGVALRRAPRDEAKFASPHDGLDACLHTEMAADLDDVFFDGPSRQAEDATNVRRALAFLDPGQAFELAIGDAP